MSLNCVEMVFGHVPSYLCYGYDLVNYQPEALTCRQWSLGKGSKPSQACGSLRSRQVSISLLHAL